MYSLKREFFITLQNLLLDKPAGFSEYQLINHFKDAQHPFFVSANLSDSLSLFRSHFVLFHLLYKLRDNLRAAGEFELHISPLQIYLAPMSSATQHSANSSALAAREPLRRYYLDLNNLQDTGRAEVDALLNSSRDLYCCRKRLWMLCMYWALSSPYTALVQHSFVAITGNWSASITPIVVVVPSVCSVSIKRWTRCVLCAY